MAQVVLFKLPLHRIRYIIVWVSVILQMYFDVTNELVVLSEYRNDWNWKLMR